MREQRAPGVRNWAPQWGGPPESTCEDPWAPLPKYMDRCNIRKLITIPCSIASLPCQYKSSFFLFFLGGEWVLSEVRFFPPLGPPRSGASYKKQ